MKFSPAYEISFAAPHMYFRKGKCSYMQYISIPCFSYCYILMFLYATYVNVKPTETYCYVLYPSSALQNTAANLCKLVSTVKVNTRSRKMLSLILSLSHFVNSWTLKTLTNIIYPNGSLILWSPLQWNFSDGFRRSGDITQTNVLKDSFGYSLLKIKLSLSVLKHELRL